MTELTSTHLKLRVTIFLYQKCSNTIKSFIFVETPYVQEKLNNKSSTTGNEDHPPPIYILHVNLHYGLNQSVSTLNREDTDLSGENLSIQQCTNRQRVCLVHIFIAGSSHTDSISLVLYSC